MRRWIGIGFAWFWVSLVYAQTPLIQEIDLSAVELPPEYSIILERVQALVSEGKRPVVAFDMDDTLYATNIFHLMVRWLSQIPAAQLSNLIPVEQWAVFVARLLYLVDQGWLTTKNFQTTDLYGISRDILSHANPAIPMQDLMARRVAYSTITLFFYKMNRHALNQIVDEAVLPAILQHLYVQQLKLIQEVLHLGGQVVWVSATANPLVERIRQWIYGDQVLSVGMPEEVQLPFLRNPFPPTISSGKLYWLGKTLQDHPDPEHRPRVLVATLGDNEFTDRAFLSFKSEEEGFKTEVNQSFVKAKMTLDHPHRSFLVNPGHHDTELDFLKANPHIQTVPLLTLDKAPTATQQSIQKLIQDLPTLPPPPAPSVLKNSWLSAFLRTSCTP